AMNRRAFLGTVGLALFGAPLNGTSARGALPVRPERHVATSITTMYQALARAPFVRLLLAKFHAVHSIQHGARRRGFKDHARSLAANQPRDISRGRRTSERRSVSC